MTQEQSRSQLFSQNGATLNQSASFDELQRNPELVEGNAHVWLWRINEKAKAEILLQKRASTKKTSPGFYHLSAGGGIDAGETAIEAAIRETSEELGVNISASSLYLVGTLRGIYNQNDFMNIFIVMMPDEAKVTLQLNEVESVKWVGIDQFEEMTQSPEGHNLLDNGEAYWEQLLRSLRKICE